MVKDALLSGKAGQIDKIDVPTMTYFAVDGQGAPGSDGYAGAVEALYAVAYGARFHGKTLGHDEKVGPLEGLWWADDYAAFSEARREEWRWTMMIRAPSWLGQEVLEPLRAAAVTKRKDKPATRHSLGALRLLTLEEGACLQALHIGPYADEAPLIARIHDEAPKQGLRLHGLHHEIYLSDPRRVPPEKLKTLLRQPVRPM
ncbi:GyrI-like domain-containing protein [Pararhodobacter sp.]|uniref:GyrI-like domain-containing protein n=1 Tax=Pararhodobacter sp. TaxID=2127056 RepID=UPI002AFE7D31|nr:GyrI-like domain-containing protein [Pararhodobacter sp.]